MPQGTIQLAGQPAEGILIVAGGRAPAMSWLQALPKDWTVYAADHGLDYCQAAGLQASYLYGDKDSVNPLTWQTEQTKTRQTKTFPVAKDDTDLQLILADLPPKALVLATGIWGGRLDHLYANIFSLLQYRLAQDSQVILADDKEIMVLLQAGDEVSFSFTKLPASLAVSLLPLAAENTVSITGVQWPLQKAELLLRKPYAISNKALQQTISASCSKGQVGFYLTFKDGK